jgi:hypothetical protein
MKFIVSILLLILLGCDSPEKEQNVSIDYNHGLRSTSRAEAIRHNIKVNPITRPFK